MAKELRVKIAATLVDEAKTLESLGQEAANLDDDAKTQMSKLEQIGLGASSFTEIISYVKRQSGRRQSGGNVWDLHFSRRVIDLVARLEERARELAGGSDEEVIRQRLPAELGGQALRHVNSAYLFAVRERKGS